MNLRPLKCMFGHNYSEWIHIPSRCVDERICKNCKLIDTKDSHRFDKWVQEERAYFHTVNGVRIPNSEHVLRFQVRFCLTCNYKQEESSQ